MDPNWISAGLGGSAFVVAVFSLLYSRRTLRTVSYRSCTDLVLECDKMFLANPLLRPYFYENEPVPLEGRDKHEVLAAAEFYLDALECIWDHRSEFSKTDYESWREWMHEVFESAPAIRETYAGAKIWYPTMAQLLTHATCTRPDDHPWAVVGHLADDAVEGREPARANPA